MARPMAANPQAAAVTDRYREQALALRRLALAAGQSAYELALIPRPGDGLGDLDARWQRFTRAAAAAAAGHQRAHVRLAADYHRAYMNAAIPSPPPPVPLEPDRYAGVMDDGRPLAAGLATGLVAVRLGLLRAEPPERALLAGWNQAGRLIGHQVLQAGRAALRDVMAADGAVTGWERVVGDEACGACLALAGGVQPDGDLPEVHDNCSCTAEPVAGDGPPGDPRPTGEELFDRLDDREQAARFAGRGGEAKAALVRRGPDGTRPVPFRELAQRHPQAVRAPVVTERPLADLAAKAKAAPSRPIVAPLTTPPAGPAPAPVTAPTFARHFDDFLKSSPNADYLTPYTRPELERMTTYLANGGRTGGAIKVADDGVREAVSLFNNGGPRGAGLAMLDRLAADGATRLDCTGDGLRAIYETRGWKVTKTIPWNDEFAPAGWDYAARGRPNIYVMEKPQ